MMSNSNSAVNAPTKTHLLVLVVQEGQVVGQRILDVARGGYRPLLKELAYRAVAGDPAKLAGRPWRLHLQLEAVDSDRPRLRCEARLKDQPHPPLAAVDVPVSNFAWVGMSIARQLEIKDYSVHVAVPEPDHPLVQQSLAWEDDDFAVSLDGEPELLLPTAFSTEPLGPRRVVRRVGEGTWLRCLFEAEAWSAFLVAAANETEVERGWLASARLHLVDDACYVVLEQLHELEGEAGQFYVRTLGREFFRLHRKLGRPLGGYLHLHPREVEGAALGPSPSGPDVTVAWNVESASTLVPVFPIAMFGASPEEPGTDVAAHGFVSGVIAEIALEVAQ
jgi:hypothetical protein